MKRAIAATIATSLSLCAFTFEAVASEVKVIKMESTDGATFGKCGYADRQLICNINAHQVESNETTIKGLFVFNCSTKLMNVKDPVIKMAGLDEAQLDALNPWYARPGIELNFVQEACRSFEATTGGEDGLLADDDYQFEYTPDGRLTCRNTQTNKLRPLTRCQDAMYRRL